MRRPTQNVRFAAMKDWLPDREIPAEKQKCSGFAVCCICPKCRKRSDAIRRLATSPADVLEFVSCYLAERDADWHVIEHAVSDTGRDDFTFRAGASTRKFVLHVSEDHGTRPWEVHHLRRLSVVDPDPEMAKHLRDLVDDAQRGWTAERDLITVVRQRERKQVVRALRAVPEDATPAERDEMAEIVTAYRQDEISARRAQAQLERIADAHRRAA